MKKTIMGLGIGVSLVFPLAQAQDNGRQSGGESVSPVFNIKQPRDRGRGPVLPVGPSDERFRTIDGVNNNTESPFMGAALTQLTRILSVNYGDSISSMAGSNRPSPRVISNAVAAQEGLIPNTLGTSDFLWQWGQFLDHDIDLTDGADPTEFENIVIPQSDPYFIVGPTMSFNRSLYASETGEVSPRQQVNEITSWIDASNVYGSEEERANALRTFDGSGQLKTSDGNLLPYNEEGLPNAGGDSNTLFLAGDVRANEQLGLTVMHTLFIREHNRLATEIAQDNPNFSADEIYEKARQIVGAQIQVITYKEFLPALLGPNTLRPYRRYNPNTDAAIANSFSTAAYRFGHSALSPTLLRLDADGNESEHGHLALREAFFSPERLTTEGGIDPILRGLASQTSQKIDPYVIDDVRNFLFGAPPANGFDLVSLNIQRGRDHGLPSYNQARVELGFSPAAQFSDISSDSEIQSRLAQAYDSVDDIDLWVGGLSEDALAGGHLGRIFTTIIARQYEALRNGDRFWYTRVLSGEELNTVERTTLADIIRRNTTIDQELQDNVFYVSTKPNRNNTQNDRRGADTRNGNGR